jgi:hypothetical protein
MPSRQRWLRVSGGGDDLLAKTAPSALLSAITASASHVTFPFGNPTNRF